MERKKVSSSQIRSIGYDSSARILEVEMSDGTIWQYSGVSSEVHRRLLAAPTIATVRVLSGYLYRRLLDLEPYVLVRKPVIPTTDKQPLINKLPTAKQAETERHP